MERQYRYPVGETVYEIPAGKLDSKQEDPFLAAQGAVDSVCSRLFNLSNT